MAHKIRLRKTGHEFLAEQQASVLHHGLNAGLNLDHSCANGACGECKAVLLEGTVEKICSHDYQLSARDKVRGVFLMCCNRAASDLVIDSHESLNAIDIPYQTITAKVGRTELLHEQVAQLSVRAPRSGGLHFLAGQSVEVYAEGTPPRRLYIASCPCDAVQLRFHVRRQEQDPFGQLVFAGLKKGSSLQVHGPVEDFTLDEDSERPLVFVAWETGFAAMASLIDHVIQKNPDRSMHLYWLSGFEQGQYQANYCRSWQDGLDNFSYHEIDLAPTGKHSFESAMAKIVEQHAPIETWDFYLTLPRSSAAECAAFLLAAGLPSAQLHVSEMERP